MVIKTWRDLTLREKVCQTVVLNGYLVGEMDRYGNPKEVIKRCGGLANFLKEYPVGGFFVGGEVIKEATQGSGDVKESIRQYRSAANIPLLFCSDMENGCGSMVKGLTPFPYLMALGAGRSEELAYAYGKATALEARSIGVNWSFSPVADLNLNRFNPITNIRAVGQEAKLVKGILQAVIAGMQDNGLVATAKHFPGDGTDYRDQHLVTTSNNLSLEQWKNNHGEVFQHLIDTDLACIMTGHISLPAFQKECVDGRYLPATLSHELTTKLLKKEMGFKGVVVSDALVMGGYLGWYERSLAELECFKAGTDMLLWPTFGFIDLLEKAVLTGEIAMERLDDAVSRIWAMKEKFGLLEPTYEYFRELSMHEDSFVKESADKVAEKSLTLLRNTSGLIPLVKGEVKKALIIAITHQESVYEDMQVLKGEFETRGVEVTLQRNVLFEELEKVEKDYDYIIYCLYTRPHQPKGPLNFHGLEAESIWASLSSAKKKSVVVSFGSPYFFNEYFEAAEVYINAYSPVPASQRALVKAIFGEIGFNGVSPVEL